MAKRRRLQLNQDARASMSKTVIPYQKNIGIVVTMIIMFIGWSFLLLPGFFVSGDQWWVIGILVVFFLLNGASVLGGLRLLPTAPKELILDPTGLHIVLRNHTTRITIARVTKVRLQHRWYHNYYRGLIVEGLTSDNQKVREGFFYADLGKSNVQKLEGLLKYYQVKG